MKDQYFGDFGDYQKISLLQTLKNKGLKVVTHWLKTSDDQSTDGKHITYLATPLLWRDYEPEIYDYLKERLSTGIRSLSHIENSPFCREIHFQNDLIEDSDARKRSFESIIESPNFDLVFFDPDNGIEVASTNKKNIHKYVLWDEISSTFNSGKSILIYQHFSRSNRDKFIQGKLNELKKRLNCEVFALRAKHSVYLFAMHDKHSENIKSGLNIFSDKWKNLGVLVK